MDHLEVVMEQVQKQKSAAKQELPEVGEYPQPAVETSRVEDILDEIDDVLEAEAEQFVYSYVQVGGQ